MSDNSKAIAKHLHEMGVEFTAQFLQNMDKDASEAIARLRTRNEQLEAALANLCSAYASDGNTKRQQQAWQAARLLADEQPADARDS